MAQAEILTIAHHIDENVIHMGKNVEGVHEGMQRVHMKIEDTNDQLQSVCTNVQSVGHEVGLINKGDLFFYSPDPESVLSLTWLGVMEATVEIQLVSKQVSDLNRS